MNRNLMEAVWGVEKADAFMFAIEKTYLDFDVPKEEMEKANRAVNSFYALWDIIRKIEDSLEKLSADAEVVDVIGAVRKAHSDDKVLKIE